MRLSKLIFAAVLMLLCSISAAAGFEGTDGVTYVPITGNDYVVDRLDGVPALYNAYDSYYQCSEYVQRYYLEVYGIEMDFSAAGPNIKTDGFSFEAVSTEPRTGDVAYIPAYNRGKSYGHWAIVKDYCSGTVTLIEQNWRWSNMAACERKISWPSASYIFYRLTNGETSSFPSCWAKDAVDQCRELNIGSTLHDNYRKPITRLEFCCMLMETVDCISPYTKNNDRLFLFDDTVSPVISDAVSLGIISQSSCFRPDDAITRQEAAVMMDGAVSALGLNGQNINTNAAPADDTVSEWALEAVENMLSLYFFVGDDSGSFMANEDVEVQHAYVLMMYLYNYAQDYHASTIRLTAADVAPSMWDFYSWEEYFKIRG
ncbi:MAG: CHAP domain-containing protein [Ruminococcaceae bacterium]|nr:CHAP domain-containing protein [Oscillospiraceae bacterium]